MQNAGTRGGWGGWGQGCYLLPCHEPYARIGCRHPDSTQMHGSLSKEWTMRVTTRGARGKGEALAIIAMLQKDQRCTHGRRCFPHDTSVLDVKLHVVLVSEIEKHWWLRALHMAKAQKVTARDPGFKQRVNEQCGFPPHSGRRISAKAQVKSMPRRKAVDKTARRLAHQLRRDEQP